MAFPTFLYHIVFGTIAFVLGLITVLLGAMFTGRIGGSKGHVELFKIHKYSGIITGIFVVFTFIFMILPPVFEGETILLGLHGWIAVSLLITTVLQVLSSLIIKDRTKLKTIHAILAYLLLGLLTVQLINGLILVTL